MSSAVRKAVALVENALEPGADRIGCACGGGWWLRGGSLVVAVHDPECSRAELAVTLGDELAAGIATELPRDPGGEEGKRHG